MTLLTSGDFTFALRSLKMQEALSLAEELQELRVMPWSVLVL